MPAVPKTPAYFSPYVLRGDTLYVSGNCGMNAQGEFIEGTVQDRTTQAMKNIEAALRANKMELTDSKHAYWSRTRYAIF
jgi:enamine deaminase RidA (YjgF/YER057c/UK114 family)